MTSDECAVKLGSVKLTHPTIAAVTANSYGFSGGYAANRCYIVDPLLLLGVPPEIRDCLWLSQVNFSFVAFCDRP